MNRFIIFLGKMHSGSDDVSSKRVYATLFVFLIIAMCIGDQYFKVPIDKFLFTSILTSLLGFCGMNLTAQLKGIEAKKDVSSSIVKETGDNEAAAGVLQSPKPGE